MLFMDILILFSAILSSSWIILQGAYYTDKVIMDKLNGSFSFRVSIIVAVKDEPKELIEKLVENLSRIEYDNYEVIIVSDDSEEKFEELKALPVPPNFSLFRRDFQGGRKAGALNYGIEKSTGEILIFLDSEARVEPDFLSRILPYMNKYEAVAMRLRIRNPESKLQRLYSEMTDFSMNSLFKGRWLRGLPIFPNGSAFSIRKETVVKVGYWREGIIAEDLEMGIRLFLKGVTVAYADDVVVETLAPFSWKDLFEQMKRWAYGSGQLMIYSLSMARKGIKGIEGIIYANQWGIYPLFILMLLIAGLVYPFLTSSILAWIFGLSIFLLSSFLLSIRSRMEEYDIRIPTLMLTAFLTGYFLGALRTKFKWKVTPKIGINDDLWIPWEVNLISFLFLLAGTLDITGEDLVRDVTHGAILLIISLIVLAIP
ncbi:glycosyltransferase family 2 protein [Metallosphaera tengchongensis]|uniref:Glycosyltransferase family 2 protein n=1 Tax=Metallosphaera tengchongensis TaxID=1532350 RepID=A0A6N0NUE4_9CREN|nr:glycosyltransferase family 2 protein [Metallosphaera tengchongensis]QKR00514.1 glycosyltransferase family 2 protein [Metallosphaera tengchongensis]